MYLFLKQIIFECISKKKNTLVSGNVGDEENVHPGGRKFIFLNQFD